MTCHFPRAGYYCLEDKAALEREGQTFSPDV
jgi:hypothetical protein